MEYPDIRQREVEEVGKGLCPAVDYKWLIMMMMMMMMMMYMVMMRKMVLKHWGGIYGCGEEKWWRRIAVKVIFVVGKKW